VTEADSEALKVEKPKQARVPFGALIESGYLSVGQSLFFAKDGTRAKILSNGHIKCGDVTGSIHGVAKALMNGAPVNGWDVWYYKDKKDKRHILDDLRKKYRETKTDREN
jgi:modification methylase